MRKLVARNIEGTEIRASMTWPANQRCLGHVCARLRRTCMLFPKSFQSNVYIWSMSRPTPVSRARSRRPAPYPKHQPEIGSSLLTVAYAKNLIRYMYSNYAHCRSHGHVDGRQHRFRLYLNGIATSSTPPLKPYLILISYPRKVI